jgi:hypothetical protein
MHINKKCRTRGRRLDDDAYGPEKQTNCVQFGY